MNSMVYIREETDSTPLTNSLQDKICIRDAGKCLQRVVVLQSGENPQKHTLFLSNLTKRLLQPDQLCFVWDFLFPEYNKDDLHCFPRRAEKRQFLQRQKIPFHPKTRADDLHAGSGMKEYCKLDRVSALDLSKLALFHIWDSQGTRAAAAKQTLSPRRPEIHLISSHFQPANGALQAESQAGFPSNEAFQGNCSLLLLSLVGRNTGQPIQRSDKLFLDRFVLVT